jgi:SHS2 domain-containing protein
MKMTDERNIGKRGFKFLEHTADVFIEAYGKNMKEVYENAALALFEVMTDTSKIDQTLSEIVEVRALDNFELLYNWLEQFLIKFEVDNNIFSKFEVEAIKKLNSELFLRAKIFGEPFDHKKHPSKVEVKAITYHDMNIEENNGLFKARFLLDI